MIDNPKYIAVKEIEARLREQYPAYQYHFVEFLTQHLADCSQVFGGDLQELLVLAIVGQMHLNAHLEAEATSDGVKRGRIPAAQITASRIADSCGIPRETVRRKLLKLASRGWVRQDEAGAWHLIVSNGASVARHDLAELDSRAITRFAGLHHQIASLLK
ncbi:MAG: helix-turn-helix domain-containing protein [Rhizobiales bacterium]|nr:helix-turn-helix domain-containing protein [Hyphomicrobiales bacterium]